jgi:hypothetical protein
MRRGLVSTRIAVSFDRARRLEALHKNIYTLSGYANHLRQGLLTESRTRFTVSPVPGLRNRHENARQACFAGVHEFAGKIFLDAYFAPQEVCDKCERDIAPVPQDLYYRGAINLPKAHVCQGDSTVKTGWFSGRDTTFAHEASRARNTNDDFLAFIGYHCQLHIASFNVEKDIAAVSLRKDDLLLLELEGYSAGPKFRQQNIYIERLWRSHLALSINRLNNTMARGGTLEIVRSKVSLIVRTSRTDGCICDTAIPRAVDEMCHFND